MTNLSEFAPDFKLPKPKLESPDFEQGLRCPRDASLLNAAAGGKRSTRVTVRSAVLEVISSRRVHQKFRTKPRSQS